MKPGRPRRPRQSSQAIWRRAAAVLLLLGIAGVVLWVVARQQSFQRPTASAAAPAAVVGEVATRLGLDRHRVHVDRVDDAGEEWWDVRIHVPSDFDARRLLLDLQAAAHNQGGRLDPLAITEAGGYARGALAGSLGGQQVRVLVVGDAALPRAAARRLTRPTEKALLAIVLDDAGHSPGEVDIVAPIPRQVAVAVLPNAPFCRTVAVGLSRQGREVLLHLPMEPLPASGAEPGEGAITVGLGQDEIQRRVMAALTAVPGVRGVNNHMGSHATADGPTMDAVMAALAGRGLYFLDSRTTAASLAQAAAQRTGIPTLRRDVFLDVVAEEPTVRRALAEAVEVALTHGQAVAIGHVHPATVSVLLAERDGLLNRVELVPPSRLAR